MYHGVMPARKLAVACVFPVLIAPVIGCSWRTDTGSRLQENAIVLRLRESKPLPGLPGYEVKIERVVSDLRCPSNRSCTISGPVTVEFRLNSEPLSHTLSILNRDTGEPEFQGIRSCWAVHEKVLRLSNVEPWPTVSWLSPNHNPTPITDDEWRITLVTEGHCGASLSPKR